jgi:hypothetical protein
MLGRRSKRPRRPDARGGAARLVGEDRKEHFTDVFPEQKIEQLNVFEALIAKKRVLNPRRFREHKKGPAKGSRAEVSLGRETRRTLS